MKEIVLSDGSICQVSDEDHIFLAGWNWTYNNGYAKRQSKGVTIMMHMVIAERMGLTGQIDHKDRNRSNNQRTNLRTATQSQNLANVGLKSENTSGYIGVSWYSKTQKWVASLRFQGRRVHLGYFDCPIKAAKAYNAAAIRYRGEFAVINILE